MKDEGGRMKGRGQASVIWLPKVRNLKIEL